jgi:NTE family protein
MGPDTANGGRPRTAFVLAGGGSLGAAQVGMLAELCAAGERPDLVVGVSAGAINAAFFARDPSQSTVTKMAALWAAMTTRNALGLSWRSLLGVVGLADHIATATGLRALLTHELGYRTFDETKVPLHVVCADGLTGQEVTISRGAVIDAVVASSAIPGVFPSVTIDDRRLVDGALAANTPIATAVHLGAERLIVLPAGFACALPRPPTRPLARAMHAITLLGARQLRHDFDRYGRTTPTYVVPPLCPVRHSAYDYSHGAELVERARRTTHDWLATGGLTRREFPDELAPHEHSPRPGGRD